MIDEARIASLSAESAAMKTAAAEMLGKMRALEELVTKLLNPAPAKPEGRIISLREAAARFHYSYESIRRWAAHDPALGAKRGGVWEIDAERLAARLKR
jgi:hypothetical protein